MPLYRGAQAELRRAFHEAHWVLAGVLIDGVFHPAHRVFEPASAQLLASGLVKRLDLPDFIAPKEHAVSVAMTLAHPLALSAKVAAKHEVVRGGPNHRLGD